MRSRPGYRLALVRFALAVVLSAVAGQVSLHQPAADGRQMPIPAMQLEREAHDLYRAQKWMAAAEKYEQALAAQPDLVGAYFYLANCYDNLYKPDLAGDAANEALIAKAVRNYELAAERDTDPRMRKLALDYLVASYGPHRLDDPAKAQELLRGLKELDENDSPAPILVDGVMPLRSMGSLAAPPRKIKHVEPVIPERALRAGVEGIVIIEVILDRQGRVRHARVLRSVPMLDEAALEAVRQWEFTPASYKGKPWPIVMTVTVALRR